MCWWEKPITSSLAEAEALIEAAKQHHRILQVGHLERFNPAVVAARKLLTTPLFFEVHRLGVFTARSLDIDVVSDLMIHDLDLVLDFVRSPVERVSAVGLPILTNKVDIANARIEFASGCVANVTASRVSTEKVRKLRFFQSNQYISLDFSRQDVVVLSVENRPVGEPPLILPRRIETARTEPLRAELESFLESVRTRRPPVVSAESSKAALALAHRVAVKIQEHSSMLFAAFPASAVGPNFRIMKNDELHWLLSSSPDEKTGQRWREALLMSLVAHLLVVFWVALGSRHPAST